VAGGKDRGVCGQEKTQADVEVGDGGGLRDAAVVVRASRGKALAVPAEPVVFDQRGCEYVPRVLAFPAGTTIAVLNSDDTLHNVHVQARTNPEVNRAMPRLQKRIAWRVEKAEWPMAVQCDTHPWMRAWWLSMDQPYYAVTDAAGRFAIADLPPGEYAVDVWHPTLGKRTEKIAAAQLKDGKTYQINGAMKDAKLRVAELP
jgi:plastocyanin